MTKISAAAIAGCLLAGAHQGTAFQVVPPESFRGSHTVTHAFGKKLVTKILGKFSESFVDNFSVDESFLEESHEELEALQRQSAAASWTEQPEETDLLLEDQRDDAITDDFLDLHDDDDDETFAAASSSSTDRKDSIQFGMMGSYHAPLQPPSGLDSEAAEEECAETFVDFATGDELCYAPDDSLRQQAPPPTPVEEGDPSPVVPRASVSSAAPSGDATASSGMGGSRNTPLKEPSRIDPQTAEEECEEVYTDFATGDELCWP